jgi:aspartate kinase
MERMFSVLKFGGSSVASATNMSRVLDLVEKEASGRRVILVASAISGCTNALLSGDPAQVDEMEKRHRSIVKRLFTGGEQLAVQQRTDALFRELREAPEEEKVTYGEILSTTLLDAKLKAEGYRTCWLDSRELVVRDDEQKTFANIAAAVSAAPEVEVFVAPGFICRSAEGRVCTLGRGGSDYSAALYAAAVQAASLQIWTDVPGIMTTNPRQVSRARTIPRMSYDAALQMAGHGAKVLYAPTVAPAMQAGIAIEILNTFAPEGGKTVISADVRETGPVGLASQEKGSVSEICLVHSSELTRAEEALTQAGIAPLRLWEEEGNLLLTVRPAVEKMALQALHRAFFEVLPVKEVCLFIAGYGAVGKALAQMVDRTGPTVEERTGKVLRLVGVANSRQYSIDLGGHPGAPCREGDYVAEVCARAPKGSVFVDCTNSETLYQRYPELFAAGLNVVSSNRRSFAVPYATYALLHAAARENGAFFRYETTVGAALPILESISRGTNSCDEVLSIEAVVSCTLNQILGDYRPGGESFASLVRKAQEAGLTEPDPRQDLGGRDALRKLLILAREAGVRLEEEEVEVTPVIPKELFDVPMERFYEDLEAAEPLFAAAGREADVQGFRRRFVASLEKTPSGGFRAGIGIRNVPPVHPAYHLRGTENAIIVRSAFHPYPLVIQGPGEGAREAASSILNDILR